MDEEVWCGLDLQLPANDVAGLHRAADDVIHDPFWPALADCTASFLAGEDMALDVDTSCFLAEHQQDLLMKHEQIYSSSSPSSCKRSLSIDSAGTTSDALTAAATLDPFAGDDAAIMRAMMAVLSSLASPSSSESSSPPQWQESSSSVQQAAAVYPRGGNSNNGLVMVRSTSLAVAPEKTTATNSGGRQQQDDATKGNNSQVYHMMSERKRREKLNDSFHTLRSLLPPCSKKDKTTVLINAASYLKKLEAEVSELEEKNAKLERHVPHEDGGAATTTAAQAAVNQRAKVQISRAPSDADQVNLTVMVMVECDIVDLVLHVLESLKWMAGVSVLSVDADTYSPQVLLKAIASIKLQITDGDCWNEASFHEVMKKVVHDATFSPSSCASTAPLVATA
ncbi:hypothetical protein PR202_ga10719 [Eleusine coracana subsp. coracana]|uniref:BHLH domain-containing protein n=1 Tax=Eleusine coracana subsp. coracana TaxID=191504 RepID=A0AAV5C7B9_ELECO|nr:hypothetical protein QOZ80_1AG0021770 [Eleusine coracana subsp. coracana]GJM94103.1 hypothetical protein PR202_ga10719 [Eleusine coracana subsp. coracana]